MDLSLIHIFAHEEKILGVIKEEMREIARKFGDKRRTQITGAEKEMCIRDRYMTVENNTIRLVATDSYRLAVCDTQVETSSLEGLSLIHI